MKDLSKLSNTMDELERQAEILKQNVASVSKVAELSKTLEKGVVELSKANSKLEKVTKENTETLEKLSEQVESIKSDNSEFVNKLILANKKLFTNFSDEINSRLTRFTSDIQVSVRQEILHLQNVLQNLIVSQFNNMELKQQEYFAKQKKQIKGLKTILIIVLTIGVVEGMALLYLLLK